MLLSRILWRGNKRLVACSATLVIGFYDLVPSVPLHNAAQSRREGGAR